VWRRSFLILLVARLASASMNLIHDCDETYNFWEPLHYLVHGVGLQTWEHAPRYGLRSYLFLGLHYAVAKPVAWLVTVVLPHLESRPYVDTQVVARHARLAPFYAVRIAVALASAFADASLATEMRAIHPVAGLVTLAGQAFSAGCFVYGSSFLPSTFAGIVLTLATSVTVQGKYAYACALCVCAVVFGWPFAGVAAVPIGLVTLKRKGFVLTTWYILFPLLVCVLSSIMCDTYMYGSVTFSTWNLLRYNVFPSGTNKGAHLYGVEPVSFYARNLTLNFGHLFWLALVAPVLGLLASSERFGRADNAGATATATATATAIATAPKHSPRQTHVILAQTYVPFLLTFLTFSSLKHKEERFVFVAYSSLCAGAGCATAALFDLTVAFGNRRNGAIGHIAKQGVGGDRTKAAGVVLVAGAGVTCVCLLTAALGTSRIAALVHGYGAPLRAFTFGLPLFDPPGSIKPANDPTQTTTTLNVCIGNEWYRFPGSFHLPFHRYRIRFLHSGFDGALPVFFDKKKGGTAFTPDGLNDENVGDAVTRVSDPAVECDFVVDFVDSSEGDGRVNIRGPYLGKSEHSEMGNLARGGEEMKHDAGDGESGDKDDEKNDSEGDDGPVQKKHSWRVIWRAPFLDAPNSPPLSRAFYVPYWSTKRNKYGTYRVFAKTRCE